MRALFCELRHINQKRFRQRNAEGRNGQSPHQAIKLMGLCVAMFLSALIDCYF